MLREAALQAYADRERLQAEELAVRLAQQARRVSKRVKEDFGFDAVARIESGTAVVDDIEFRLVSGAGRDILQAMILGPEWNVYRSVYDLCELGRLLHDAELPDPCTSPLPVFPEPDLVETAGYRIDSESYEEATALALLSIARSLEAIVKNGIITERV